jgi:UDP-glucose 4-epimerase
MITTFGSQEKVLVTGGSGFLGSHLCRRLLECGAEVHATSRLPRAQQGDGPLWWQADLADIAAAHALVSKIKPDVIYHLAGSVGASPARELVMPTFHSLLVSTVNLLTAVTETGCRRLVLTGSLTEPQASQAEAMPGSPYAAAKWASSAYGRMFHSLYGTPCVIARIFMTYGPAQDPRKIIPAVTLALLKGEAPRLSSGRWKADWIYIDDVIDGLLAAAQAPHVEGCTFDLGSGVLVTVRAIVQQLVKLVCTDQLEPMFGALPDRPFEQVRVAKIAGAEVKLGWKPLIPFNEGLMRTVEWYRTQMNAGRR